MTRVPPFQRPPQRPPRRIHVIGAGLAGLAAAVRLREAGVSVCVHEAAPQAGGRCRSFFDPTVGRVIDNGTHLLLSSNHRVQAYLDTLGVADTLVGPSRARLDFLDLATDERWTLAPNRGRLPWWILDPQRRVPGTTVAEYGAAARLLWAGPDATVARVLDPTGPLYRRLWAPLCVGVLNTPPEHAAAAVLAPVLRETFGRGEAACRPRLARDSLSATFIDPALAWLDARAVPVRFGRRLVALERVADRASALVFADGERLDLDSGDGVVLAVPPWSLHKILPEIATPDQFNPIVNIHYRLDSAPPDGQDAERRVPLGLLGGMGEWLFVRGDVLSVTISAAVLAETMDPEILAQKVWEEVVRARPGQKSASFPAFRVIKERRATFAQTPSQVAKRPACRTALADVHLAGDWTNSKLPATIEGAIRSGETAAYAALHYRST